MNLKSKVKQHLKTALKETVTFVKNNKIMLFYIGVQIVSVSLLGDNSVGECTDAIKGANNTKSGNPLVEPLTEVAKIMTGPIPMGFTLVSGATAAISWGAGWEQSITQRAMKCLGGGAVATGAGKGFEWAGLDGVTGCLM